MSSELGWRGHRHLLSIDQFSRTDIEDVLYFSKKLEPYSGEGSELSILRGRILKPMFFEPSSRTIDRHTSAIQTMGGRWNPALDAKTSSMEKGESEVDTVVTAAQTSDILAIRHPVSFSVNKFADYIDGLRNNHARVINCGDGPHGHPTQALLDDYTVLEGFGTLDNLIWLIVGDLEYGRPVHSHMFSIPKFSNNKIIGFPVGGLGLTKEYKPKGYEEFDFNYLSKIPSQIDPNSSVVLYVTRVQFERIAKNRYPDYDTFDEAKKKEIRDETYREFQYEITSNLLNSLPDRTKLLHPLPRGSEINDEVFWSHNPKVAPIEQMRYGLQVTMSYLALFSGAEEKLHEPGKYLVS